MNLDHGDADAISPVHWERVEMRQALAHRDLKTVYELLGRLGISQHRIARLTGQAQSEVYAVLNRGRQVVAHDVLVRVADGLGVPRGYLGLAYDDETAALLKLGLPTPSLAETEGRDQVHSLLAHAAAATMGVTETDTSTYWQPIDQYVAPVPDRIGTSDVAHVEALTDAMRLVDDKHGGGACRDAIAAQVRWSQQLLAAQMTEDTRKRLLIALADLHVLAGWSSFDLGMHMVAASYFKRGIDLSRAGDSWALTATVLYTMARLHLHIEMPSAGLRFLQLGQIAAQSSGNGFLVSLIYVNEAWAHAMMDNRHQMERSLVRAADELHAADNDQPRRWPRFYGQGELHAMTGTAQSALPSADDALLDTARQNLEHSFTERGDEHPRSSALALPILALTDLRLGNLGPGLDRAGRALDAARQINSARIVDRLTPLASQLGTIATSDARDIQTGINALQGAS